MAGESDNLEEVARLLSRADRVTFLTGAGISRESGIPTFREAQTGLWAKFNPEELATPEAFRRNPSLVWRWYDERRAQIQSISPNPGHLAIAELERWIESVVVVTQNVDGLHAQAGSRKIVELHGNIRSFFCFDRRHPAQDVPFGLEDPPACHCGSLLRPAVVWFGELLPPDALESAHREILQSSVVFVVGTSSLVYPAASLPHVALDAGIPVVEINPERTPLTREAIWLPGKAGEILPSLLRCLHPLRAPRTGGRGRVD